MDLQSAFVPDLVACLLLQCLLHPFSYQRTLLLLLLLPLSCAGLGEEPASSCCCKVSCSLPGMHQLSGSNSAVDSGCMSRTVPAKLELRCVTLSTCSHIGQDARVPAAGSQAAAALPN